MAEIPTDLLVHTIQVETYVGTGARGDKYAPVVNVDCFVEDARRLVRTTEGEEVISESTVYAAPASLATLAAKSRVTLPDGRKVTVIVRKNHDDGGLGAPQHVEANTT